MADASATTTTSEADYVRELRELEAYLNLEFGLVRGGLRPPLLLGGRFELKQLLGRGAKGLVCQARQLSLGRDVALKLYPARASERLIQSVAAEARALARFRHPAIVHVYSVEHADLSRGGRSVLYVEMELLERGTLRDWLKQPRRAGEILEVFVHAGEGLAAAHDQDLLHCDFKPDNVVFGADGKPRVVDFGLARATTEAAGPSLVGSLIGTPAYAAPESFGGAVSSKSDQYSYAASMWQALFKAFPYDETVADLRARGVLREPPPRSDLADAVVTALRRALSERPEQRFPGIRDLLAALRPQPRDGPAREWGTFSDERPDYPVRAGSIWPAVLGLIAIAAVAGAVYVRQFELDGGMMDWSRASMVPSLPEPSAPAVEEPSEIAQGVPVEPVPPVISVPPSEPVAPSPSACALDGVVAGRWRFETVAVWAAHAEVHGVRGKYGVEFSPGSSCTYDTKVRKLGAGATTYSPPPSDRSRAPAARWGAGGARVVADVRLARRSDAELMGADFRTDPGGLHYVFEYMITGDRLLGHWRFIEGETTVMLGVLGGRRGDVADNLTMSASDLPCSSQCAVRCPGEEARGRCERELCTSAGTRVVDCGAPGLDFVAPPSTLTPNAPQSFYGGANIGEDQCRKIADHLAGAWTIHARATRGSKTARNVHTYTLQLRADGCTLMAKDARRGEWPLEVTGSVRGDGRWTLHYSDHGREGDWMLVGRDPAFGAFRAESGAEGTVAAYKTSPP